MFWQQKILLSVILCHVIQSQHQQSTTRNHHKLLLISLDGFKADYMEEAEKFEVFNFMKNNGVKAEYMIPPFPTLTLPIHTTLATGLYAENHGVIHNNYFDHKTQRRSKENYLTTEAINEWFDSGYEPIWISATNHGLKSGCYMFPGCNATIGGKTATRSVLQTIVETSRKNGFWDEKVEAAVSWLSDEDFDFVALYFETIDNDGHYEELDNIKRKETWVETNSLLMELFERLNQRGILHDVNVIITSDHGMHAVDRSVPHDDFISISKYIKDESMIKFMMLHEETVGYIEPAESHTETVYNLLKAEPHMDVYCKQDIPERWRLKNHHRVPSVLLVAHPGYTLYWIFEGKMKLGEHGYDNDLPEMRTIFYAIGPDFKSGFVSEPFETIHVYELMCHLLDVQPAPNNGTLKVLQPMLVSHHTFDEL